MPPDQPPTVGQQLGVGRNWKPAPASWRWAQVNQGTQMLHVLIVEGTDGAHALALSDDALDRLIESAQAERAGLALERGDPMQLPGRIGLPSIGRQ
jgi:hypothetical protein